MAPSDYLSLVVEVAIAIAGFSGIAFALGWERTRQWGAMERERLGALVSTSFIALGVSALALLLIASGVEKSLAWRVASGVSAAIVGVVLPRRIMTLLRVSSPGSSHATIWFFAALSASVPLLLVANVLWIHAFWPLGTAVTYHLAMGLISFVGLIVPPSADADEA